MHTPIFIRLLYKFDRKEDDSTLLLKNLQKGKQIAFISQSRETITDYFSGKIQHEFPWYMLFSIDILLVETNQWSEIEMWREVLKNKGFKLAKSELTLVKLLQWEYGTAR